MIFGMKIREWGGIFEKYLQNLFVGKLTAKQVNTISNIQNIFKTVILRPIDIILVALPLTMCLLSTLILCFNNMSLDSEMFATNDA